MNSRVLCLLLIAPCAASFVSGASAASAERDKARPGESSEAMPGEAAPTPAAPNPHRAQTKGSRPEAPKPDAKAKPRPKTEPKWNAARILRDLTTLWEHANAAMLRGGPFMWVVLSSLLFALPAALSCLLTIVSSRRRREASWIGFVMAAAAIVLPAILGIVGWRIGMQELDSVVQAGLLNPNEGAEAIEHARNASRLPLLFGLGATGALSVPWLLLLLVLAGRRKN